MQHSRTATLSALVVVLLHCLAAAAALNSAPVRSQLYRAQLNASSGAALCGLGSTPILTSTVRSTLDCSNRCVGINCSAFNYWQNNGACQLFAVVPSCQVIQQYCTLYQVRDLSVV